MSEKKSKAALEKTRGPNGKFIKGVSGNPKGRPKKAKPDDLPKDFHDKVGSDPKKAYKELLKSASSRYEAAKYAKELFPYEYPKLSNVESTVKEIKSIEIKWLDSPGEDPALEHQASNTIEGTIKDDEIILDDNLET